MPVELTIDSMFQQNTTSSTNSLARALHFFDVQEAVMTQGATRQREHGTMEFWPKTPEERIEAFRHIVSEKAYAKIDGVMIDMTSAHLTMQVYDRLSEHNQQKFAKHESYCMVHIALGVLEKARA